MGRKPASDPLNEEILNAIHSSKMCTKLRKDCTADEKIGIEKSINEIVNKFQNDEGLKRYLQNCLREDYSNVENRKTWIRKQIQTQRTKHRKKNLQHSHKVPKQSESSKEKSYFMTLPSGKRVTQEEFDQLEDGPGVVMVDGKLMPEEEVYDKLHPPSESEVENEDSLDVLAEQFDEQWSEEEYEHFLCGLPSV